MTRLTLRATGIAAILTFALVSWTCRTPTASAAVTPPGTSPTPVPAVVPAAAGPSLIVLITIDQFGAEYLQRFGAQMTGGIARLMRGGAWFTDAHHDHAITETAPGHATLLSGRFPRSTGIMMNSIGVDDDQAPLLANGYGNGASPRRFIGTTLVDWMRKDNSKTRVLSVSMKDRGAILPNGKSTGEVYWYSPDGRFVTSSYFNKALPPWVRAFNERQVPASYAGKTWTLLLPDSAYHEPDSVAIERGGRNFQFPYPLPDDPFDAVNLVRATPFIDDIVADFALSGVRALELGATARTDLLAISLSATDVVGHAFGPDSREIHDQVLRVDRAIGRLLDSLYAMRDSSTITVVLTSDHGVGRIPELAARSGTPAARRVSLDNLLPPVRAKLRAAGIDTMAFVQDQAIVLLDRAAFRNKKSLDPDSLLAYFAGLARQEPGVARADRFQALLADTATDVFARRWAHQFPADVNVELIINLTPMSTWGGNVASHGSAYDYDSRVPLILSGFGIQPGTFKQFVRTVDLAPTLAELVGVKPMERLDGVPLSAALRGRAGTP
jgi:Type I phosphodiesterase / nucleotide pyrophosphatase